MKKEVLFFIAGAAAALGITAFAAQVELNPNSFGITLNGTPVEIEGYNIDGNTYFKLRDIGDKVGFDVDFENDTIIISHKNQPPVSNPSQPPLLPTQLPEGEGATPESALAELKQRLETKVASGEMTQAEADEILAQFGEISPSADN